MKTFWFIFFWFILLVYLLFAEIAQWRCLGWRRRTGRWGSPGGRKQTQIRLGVQLAQGSYEANGTLRILSKALIVSDRVCYYIACALKGRREVTAASSLKQSFISRGASFFCCVEVKKVSPVEKENGLWKTGCKNFAYD